MTATATRTPPGVDPRIEQRRRLVAAERRRRRLRWLLAVTVVVALVAAGWGLTRTAVLDVGAIEVAGADRTGAEAVVAASGVVVGDPLLDVDPASAATAVEALPWVADATVVRAWRDGIVRIDVVERTPAAAVVVGEQLAVVDAGGRVLEVGATAGPPASADGLARVEGAGPLEPGQALAPEAVPLVEVAMALTPGVRTRVVAVRAAGDEVELVLQPSGVVRFGAPVDVDEKVRTLQTAFAETQLDCLAAVDVRVPDTAVLTREPTCA